MSKVISGNLRLELDGKTIFHATNCSLTMNREFRERSTKDTTGIERAKSTKSWSASYEGLAVYAGGTTSHDFKSLFELYDDDDDTPVSVEFTPDEDDATWYFQGTGFIESLEGNFAVREDATISLSVLGNGAIETKTIT